jgi:hypothetical protein
MSSDQVVALIGASGALMLATRNLRSFQLSFEVKAWMLLVWLLIVIALVVIGGHLPTSRSYS